MPTAFFSYKNLEVARAWVELAGQQFAERQIIPHNYKKVPETSPDMPEALDRRIAECDVFICVLNQSYLEYKLTLHELTEATRLSTGSPEGNLRKQKGKPFVHIFCEDQY